ncbi:hypothetical protein Tco_1000271 [Tanacetum coccineum]
MGNVKKSLAERTRHKRQYDRRMNERQMQSRESKVVSSKALDASLVVTECGGTKSDEHITSSSSGTYITHAVDADIRPVNDQVPFVEVESNTTPDSTNMCHRGGEIDQDAEQYKVKSPLLKAELVRSKEMIEKETYNELSRRFLLLEKHCISLEISIQQKKKSFQSNKPCKNQDAPEFYEIFKINYLKAQLQAKTTLICNLKNQIKSVKEASNEAKVKHDIDVLKTINIELESSVAKLLVENKKLNKENEHLTQTYKELYDSIKKTRIQTKDHNDSLIAQVNSKTVENADLKAQIQEKVFANLRESAPAKPHHVIARGSSRNSSKESYGSNDMAHNYYLEEAKKKSQDKNRNLNLGKCLLLEHITLLMLIQPNKTKNSNKPVDPTSHTQKPGRKIVTGHSFSPNKSFDVHEKTNTPRSCLRWIPTGRIFNTGDLKWVPTGKTFTSSTTKVDCEPPNGSNECITNPYECDQTFNVSAETKGSRNLGPLLKEKKGVRFSALYLQKNRNLLVSYVNI